VASRTPEQYDWTNALFNDRRLTKHFTSPRRSQITHVTLHHMTIVAPADKPRSTVALEGCYRTWQNREASANYGVSGELVWQFVSDFDAAWSDANNTSNHSTLSIEHANSTAGPKWQISDETMRTGQRLVATLHRLYGLGRPSRKTVRVHQDYYATACPGPYMMAHLDDYIAAAAHFYDNPDAADPGGTTGGTTEPDVQDDPAAVLDASNYPDAAHPDRNTTGPQITWLGQRLVAHGFGKHYQSGPGPNWSNADRENVRDFQEAQGWTGDGADGYPGPTTLRLLAADPKPTPPAGKTVKVRAMFTPFAGYNAPTKPGVLRWKKNTDGGAAIILKHKPDLVGTTEVAKKWYCNMLPRLVAAVSSLLILVNGGSDGRYIFRNPATTTYLFRKLVTTPDRLEYRGDDKQGFILGYRKDGADGIFAVFHAENEAGFDKGRVDQALWFADQVETLRATHGIDERNVLIVMDSNSSSWVAEAFKGHGYKVIGVSSFVGWNRDQRKPFDLAITKGTGKGTEISSEGCSDHDFMVIDFQLVVA
jgi:hypothetical protein